MQSEKKRKTQEEPTDVRSKFIKLDEPTADVAATFKLPQVVHLRRSKGQVVQDCDIYIGRACNMGGWRLPQSKWSNPYSVKQHGRDGALDRYRTYVESNQTGLLNDLHELDGKRLGCWCAPSRCHGDILRALFQREMSKSSS